MAFACGLLALTLFGDAMAQASEIDCPYFPRLCYGLDAYRNHDYAAALRYWRPLAVARQSGWEARDNQDGFSAVATRG